MAIDAGAFVHANVGYDGTEAGVGPNQANITQFPWLVKEMNPYAYIPGFKAEENLGHGVNKRWPDRPLDSSGFPLFLNSATGKLKAMTLTDYDKYFGMLMIPADAGQAVQVLKKDAVIIMPVGSKPVAALDLVMAETSGSGTVFDVIPQNTFDGDDARWFQCPTASVPTITETTFFGGSLASIKEGTWTDASANTNYDLVVVDVTPTANYEIQLTSATTFKFFNQLDVGDRLEFNGSWKPSPKTHTIGRALEAGAARTSATVYDVIEVLLLDG
jgi:hypothetical protein